MGYSITHAVPDDEIQDTEKFAEDDSGTPQLLYNDNKASTQSGSRSGSTDDKVVVTLEDPRGLLLGQRGMMPMMGNADRL